MSESEIKARAKEFTAMRSTILLINRGRTTPTPERIAALRAFCAKYPRSKKARLALETFEARGATSGNAGQDAARSIASHFIDGDGERRRANEAKVPPIAPIDAAPDSADDYQSGGIGPPPIDVYAADDAASEANTPREVTPEEAEEAARQVAAAAANKKIAELLSHKCVDAMKALGAWTNAQGVPCVPDWVFDISRPAYEAVIAKWLPSDAPAISPEQVVAVLTGAQGITAGIAYLKKKSEEKRRDVETAQKAAAEDVKRGAPPKPTAAPPIHVPRAEQNGLMIVGMH